LRVQIGILYALLAFVNIVFFSILIFENQSDLLTRAFQLQSENIANSLYEDLALLKKEGNGKINLERLKERLGFYEIYMYRFLNSEGEELEQNLLEFSDRESQPRGNFPQGEKLKSILEEINPESSNVFFQGRYNIDLDESDFSLTLTIPVSDIDRTMYLQARLYLKGLSERLERIYYFIFLTVGWGIIFHILFALYVYRVIFIRMGILKTASEKMASGDLEARAVWNRKRNDELDELGDSFNVMAGKIQETIETVTRLNTEINLELQIGKEVQDLFLPSRKIARDFYPGIYYRPLREVSGDLYLFFRKSEKELFSVFIADASGHGVSASLVTVTIAVFLESLWKEGLSVQEIIGELSRMMGSRLQSSFFATAVCAEWNGKNLNICNGGHNPPLIFSKEIGFLEIASSGPPLGMVDEHEYKSEIIPLKKGDKIFLYTDGLTESLSDDNKMYGIARVKEHLESGIKSGFSNQEIVDAIARDLANFTKEYKDDITMILLEIPEG